MLKTRDDDDPIGDVSAIVFDLDRLNLKHKIKYTDTDTHHTHIHVFICTHMYVSIYI